MPKTAKKLITTRGKPFQSRLAPFEAEVKQLKVDGMSVRDIASEMMARHRLQISHNAVASFLRTHGRRSRNFLDGISATKQGELLKALKALWTHDSTAIEGNTLSLGDTMAILEYGLTVKGKPLKDHQDIVAHAHAIDYVRELAEVGRITRNDIFKLHRLLVTSEENDIYKPIGAWKREDNGTYGVENGRPVYMAYASADDTDALMAKWIAAFNRSFDSSADEQKVIDAYVAAHMTFVRIHPFFNGNGRLARLLANLPVLFAGMPPIVIPFESRMEYISTLWNYQRAVGKMSAADTNLLPKHKHLQPFKELVKASWKSTLDMIAEARG